MTNDWGEIQKNELSRVNTYGVSKTFFYRHREHIAILDEKPDAHGYWSCSVFESIDGRPYGPGCIFVLKDIPQEYMNIAIDETISQFLATRPENIH